MLPYIIFRIQLFETLIELSRFDISCCKFASSISGLHRPLWCSWLHHTFGTVMLNVDKGYHLDWTAPSSDVWAETIYRWGSVKQSYYRIHAAILLYKYSRQKLSSTRTNRIIIHILQETSTAGTLNAESYRCSLLFVPVELCEGVGFLSDWNLKCEGAVHWRYRRLCCNLHLK